MPRVPAPTSLPPRKWKQFFINQSCVTYPLSRTTGATASLALAEILSWPGPNKPAENWHSLRSQGPGVTYLFGPEAGVDPVDPGTGVLQASWWLYYDHATADLDFLLLPIKDSELAVYLAGLPGHSIPTATAYNLTPGAADSDDGRTRNRGPPQPAE